MSVKYFNKQTNKWEIFPGTVGAPGKDAYTTAYENGYTGTPEEFYSALAGISELGDNVNSLLDYIDSSDSVPTKDSENLVLSGGVYEAIDDLNTSVNKAIESCEQECKSSFEEVQKDLLEINNKIEINSQNISNERTRAVTVEAELHSEILNETSRATAVEESLRSKTDETRSILDKLVIDSLLSEDNTKALSAKQGKILKSLIDSIYSFRIEFLDNLPVSGESHVLYLLRKIGASSDTYDEYLYVDGKWEIVGNLSVDLTQYYTKDEINQKFTETKESIDDLKSEIPSLDGYVRGEDLGKYALKSEIPTDYVTSEELNSKQDILKSGINIKTINNQSLLGEGNLEISSNGTLSVDDSLNDISENPVQNKAIKQALDGKVGRNELDSYLLKSEAETTYQKTGDYVTNSDLEDYATEEWVGSQGYLTEIPEEYVTDDELSNKLSDYALKSDVPSSGSALKFPLGLWKGGTPEYEKEFFNGSEAKEIHYMPSFELAETPGAYGYCELISPRTIEDLLAPGQTAMIGLAVSSPGDKLTFNSKGNF